MKWNYLKWALIALFFLLPSCTLPTEAEKSTCEAVSSDHATYVEQDANLTDVQKASRHRLLNSWRLRVGLPIAPEQPSELRTKPIVPPQDGGQ